MQAYSDPKREYDPFSLPDVEVWKEEIYTLDCPRCGDNEVSASCAIGTDETVCVSCESSQGVTAKPTGRDGWFWRFCWPACLPESGEHGPYDSADEALAEAQANP